MLVLTEEIGQPVVDADGRTLGRVGELVVDARDEEAKVVRVGIRRGRRITGWVDWSHVVAYERSGVLLGPGAEVRAGAVPPAGQPSDATAGDLWLRRDVLDAQILDQTGERLVRVGDLVLLRVDHDLRVIAVQFGAGPVLRRLGLRRLATRLGTVAVEWHELRIVSGRGMAVQLAASGSRLDVLGPAQLAAVVAQLSTDRARVVLGAVGPHRAADALRLAHPDVRSRLVHALPHPFATEVLARMPSDDATAALRGISRRRRAELLAAVDAPRADTLRALLAAHPDTAAGLMSTDVCTAPVGTPADALRAQLLGAPPRTSGLEMVFVLDDLGHPVGVVSALALLDGGSEADPRPAPVVAATTGIDAVVDLFATRDIRAVAVVDEDGRMVGAVAIEDVLDELVAERLPGRSRFHHLLARHRTVRPDTGGGK